MTRKTTSKRALSLLGTALLALMPLIASAQTAAPPNPEPNNILRPNQDATYSAVKARQTATLQAITTVTEAVLRAPADGDGLTWRRTPASLGFSPLKQVNKTTIKQLGLNWAFT